mmetsp:Transcript_58167/g.131837  ORF Transcript_58167/g.131837 Transcript_58167/m.131837 type:complete len:268 (+) Transcript_58167:737-1540(+)
MRSATLNVHFCLSDVPLLDTFFHGAGKLFFRRYPTLRDTINHNNPLGILVDLDRLLPRQPRQRASGRQSLWSCKDIDEGVLVEFEHVATHGVGVPRHSIQGFKQVVQRPRCNSGLISGSVHGVRLASPRLAVGKNGYIVPINSTLNHVLDVAKHVFLLRVRPEDGVEAKGKDLVLGSRGQPVALPLLGHLELEGEAIEPSRDLVVTAGRLRRYQRPDTAEYPHSSFHVLDDVVVLLPLLSLLAVQLLQLTHAGLEPARVDVASWQGR